MKQRAIRKVEIAIDKMIDLQAMGIKAEKVDRILDMLNGLTSDINFEVIKKPKSKPNR